MQKNSTHAQKVNLQLNNSWNLIFFILIILHVISFEFTFSCLPASFLFFFIYIFFHRLLN